MPFSSGSTLDIARSTRRAPPSTRPTPRPPLPLRRRSVRRFSWLQSACIAALWRFRPSQGVESAIVIFSLEYATLLSWVKITHSAGFLCDLLNHATFPFAVLPRCGWSRIAFALQPATPPKKHPESCKLDLPVRDESTGLVNPSRSPQSRDVKGAEFFLEPFCRDTPAARDDHAKGVWGALRLRQCRGLSKKIRTSEFD